MRFDVSNFEALRNAVTVYDGARTNEALVIVFQTPGGQRHRFIINHHGIERQLCDGTGEPLDGE